MSTPEIVVIGGPASGKTHYGGQLYGRLRRNPGRLKLREGQGTPTDLSLLAEVLSTLENGKAAGHTPQSTSAQVTLPLEKAGRTLDLKWPDYGGEQIEGIFQDRQVPEGWKKQLQTAQGWLLLLRLKSETTWPDTLHTLTERPRPVHAVRTEAKGWDANARRVELLQILLHAAGHGTAHRLGRPRLAILLSCYDELAAEQRPPRDVLAEHLPLLAAFIESTWQPEQVSIWGLSALGRPLSADQEDDTFIDDGPEHQGWVVPPEGGEKDPDLTRPLDWLLGGL